MIIYSAKKEGCAMRVRVLGIPVQIFADSRYLYWKLGNGRRKQIRLPA